MSTNYQETADGIGPNDLQGLFVGWPNRLSPEGRLKILHRSDLLVLALSMNLKVVRFFAAITDGVSCAQIPYIEVLPEWQGKGMGTELMRPMMAQLSTIFTIDLIRDEDVQEFSEKLGFKASRGMITRKHPIQGR